MQEEQDPAKKIQLIQFSSLFAKYYSQIDNNDTLYVIAGHHKSGRSIFIDLLSGKQLTAIEQPLLGTMMLVEKNNCQREYQPLYIQKFRQQLSIQSFTLLDGQELKASRLQTIKLIFLQQYLKICKKVAFVILVEQAMLQSIPKYLEDLLSNLGITSNDKNPNIDILKEYIYLLLTKTDDVLLKNNLKQLDELTENQNVKEIIKYLADQDSFDCFKRETPQENYAVNTKNKFKPKPFDNKVFDFLKNSFRRIDRPFIESELNEVINLLQNVSKLIISLILFASTENKSFQRQYETLALELYPNNLIKNRITSMIGKWNKSSLQKIPKLKSLATIKDTVKLFQVYSQCLLQILTTLKQANQNPNQFKQIQGKIVFFSALSRWWFPSKVFEKRINQIISQFKDAIIKAQSSQKPKNQLKPKARPVQKKNAFGNFKQAIQQCKNNSEALKLCLQKIKEKEKDQKNDYFEVIYYIKMVRDLLQEFISPNSIQNHIFIEQLLEIALYTDNYYDFQNYLKIALRKKVLQIIPAKNLLKSLYDTNKFEYCERIVDYLIAECKDDDQFQKYAKFKVNLKIKINEQYKSRQKQSDNKTKSETKKKILTFQYNDLQKKSDVVSSLRKYLEGRQFQRHILSKQ